MDLGLRQRDVAELIGCDKDTITNWENGHRSPTISHTAKVAEFLRHFYDLRNATNAVYVPEIEQATHEYSLSAKKGESI
jgi:transcriptional regulator with XRE-family HTH domain